MLFTYHFIIVSVIFHVLGIYMWSVDKRDILRAARPRHDGRGVCEVAGKTGVVNESEI